MGAQLCMTTKSVL